MERITAVIFDLDGTLLNTLHDIAACCNEALSVAGLPKIREDAVQRFVGNGISKLMERAVGNADSIAYQTAVRAMREFYADHGNKFTRPYNGIEALLAELTRRSIKIAVVSNKPDAQVKYLCKTFFEKIIPNEAAIGENEALGIKKKPSPDSVFTAMKLLGSDKNTTIYVGDSDVDIETAQNAGIPCISVSWGFRSRNFLLEHGASKIIDNPLDLLETLTYNKS